ncbi:unnamed protein product [Paramecium pentaurelia]|uniref:Uncharacterized protein n=1 Tax=Paramecium pentaurelia TaxID=43138 RepID=A0A8S1UYI8_9CILI|nr:unnamed protein product [Paramecium pentaurelia]
MGYRDIKRIKQYMAIGNLNILITCDYYKYFYMGILIFTAESGQQQFIDETIEVMNNSLP